MLTLSDATRLAEILHAVRSYAHADSMILSRVVAATGISAKTIKRLADEHPDQIAVDTTYTATRQIYRVRLTAEKPTRTPKHPLKDPPAGFTGDDGQFAVCPICQRRRPRWSMFEGLRIPSGATKIPEFPFRLLDLQANGKVLDRNKIYPAGLEICRWHAVRKVESGESRVESRTETAEARS